MKISKYLGPRPLASLHGQFYRSSQLTITFMKIVYQVPILGEGGFGKWISRCIVKYTVHNIIRQSL